MILQDTVLITKKIAVGILLFLVPLFLLAGILWLIQYYLFN